MIYVGPPELPGPCPKFKNLYFVFVGGGFSLKLRATQASNIRHGTHKLRRSETFTLRDSSADLLWRRPRRTRGPMRNGIEESSSHRIIKNMYKILMATWQKFAGSWPASRGPSNEGNVHATSHLTRSSLSSPRQAARGGGSTLEPHLLHQCPPDRPRDLGVLGLAPAQSLSSSPLGLAPVAQSVS